MVAKYSLRSLARHAASHFKGALLTGAMLTAQPAGAAPPQCKYLYPAGAQIGTTVEIEAHGTFERWPVQAWVDRPGVSVCAKEAKGKFAVTVSADAIPSAYGLRLFDRQGATSLLPFVIGTLPEIVEQEPNDAPPKAQELSTPNVVVNGELQSKGDVDTFAVRLDAGQTLVAEIEAQRTLASPVDTILEIVSTDGFVLAHNDDDQATDPRIVFVAPKSGVYLVRTFGFPATPNSTIALAGGEGYVYRLTVTVTGFLDYSLPLATAADLQQVEARGWNLPAEAQHLMPCLLPSGREAVVWHPKLGNSRLIPVVDHRSILAVEPDESGASQGIELPVTITGRIEGPRDKDSFLFAAKAGETVNLRVESRLLGYPLDPVLEVRDGQGKTLTRVDDTGDSRDTQLAFAVPADGEYQVVVSDLHRHGGPNFVYRLTATVASPDYSLSLTGDSFVVDVGQKLEIPIAIERLHGFKAAINLRVEGLPGDVALEPVVSLGEGDSAKNVKLVMTAGNTAFSGPIRIAGSVPDAGPAHYATAPLAGRAQRATEIWLTIAEAKKD